MTKFFYDTEFIEAPGTLQLISIGMVAEDNQTYYGISKDFDPWLANEWVKKNVLGKLERADELPRKSTFDLGRDILAFMQKYPQPWELWGYFAAYDHVLLCWCFGSMIELPQGLPMFTRDIMQWAAHLGFPKLPVQETGAHNALADAKWHKQMYDHLDSLIVNGKI